MKTNLFMIAAILLASCSGGNKEAQLEALKTKRDKLNVQIEQLEAELAAQAESSGEALMASSFVSIEDMEPRPFNHYVEVQGRLDGDQNIAIFPETAGNVVDISVKAGQRVSAGQVLARLNDAAYQEQLKTLETTFALAQETFQKQENLWNQQIGSEMQYLQAKTNKESLESQMEALKKQIDMTRIKSPINGTIEESDIKVGQAVSPAMPVFRVVNFNNLKVTAEVAEAYADKIHTGDEVIVYLPDIKQEIRGRISFTSKYINPVNRTYTVEAQLQTPSSKLKANMVAVMKIKDYHVPQAYVLPLNLVQKDNNGEYVLVATAENENYYVRKKPIETGQVYNGLAEIIKGLETGEKVITGGYLNLDEGEPVRF